MYHLFHLAWGFVESLHVTPHLLVDLLGCVVEKRVWSIMVDPGPKVAEIRFCEFWLVVDEYYRLY